MKRYIALLRGINVGGNNKILMSELKQEFINMKFSNVNTYLNSGNVIFSTSDKDEVSLASKIRTMILDRFHLNIPIYIISQEDLEDVLSKAPDWWGTPNKGIYDNIIFLFPSLSFEELYETIGSPKEELEMIYNYKGFIFWSFSRENYQKTNWWSKTTLPSISHQITIRTANTVRRIVNL